MIKLLRCQSFVKSPLGWIHPEVHHIALVLHSEALESLGHFHLPLKQTACPQHLFLLSHLVLSACDVSIIFNAPLTRICLRIAFVMAFPLSIWLTDALAYIHSRTSSSPEPAKMCPVAPKNSWYGGLQVSQ